MLADPDDVRLLTQVGFLAAARGDVKRAEVIFGALERARPAAAFAYVGMGMACLNAGRADDAVAVLDRGLKQADSKAMPDLHAFRGLALQLAGRASESVRALGDAPGIPLAQAMLGKSTIRTEGN